MYKSKVQTFFMMAHNIFCVIVVVFSLRTKGHINSHESRRKHQITVRFTDHTRIVCSQYGTCCVSLFCCSEFRGGFKIFRKFLDCWFTLSKNFIFCSSSCKALWTLITLILCYQVERERDKERLEAKRRLDQLKKSTEEEQEENKKKVTEVRLTIP